jgi:hypothetical protein
VGESAMGDGLALYLVVSLRGPSFVGLAPSRFASDLKIVLLKVKVSNRFKRITY